MFTLKLSVFLLSLIALLSFGYFGFKAFQKPPQVHAAGTSYSETWQDDGHVRNVLIQRIYPVSSIDQWYGAAIDVEGWTVSGTMGSSAFSETWTPQTIAYNCWDKSNPAYLQPGYHTAPWTWTDSLCDANRTGNASNVVVTKWTVTGTVQ